MSGTSALVAGLTAFACGGAGLAIIIGIGRFVLRWRKRGKLFADDYIHMFALAMLTGQAVSWSIALQVAWRQRDSRDVFLGNFGSIYSFQGDLAKFTSTLTIIWQSFYWAAIFSARAVFLAFYRQVFRVSKTFIFWWYIVCVLVTCAYLIAFLSMFWSCGTPSNISRTMIQSLWGLVSEDGSTTFSIIAIACNVASDLLVMILPMFMIARLQISTGQKWRIAGVFLLATATIVVDVWAWDLTKAYRPVFVFLEALVAVIISALPAYGLLGKHGDTPTYSLRPPTGEENGGPLRDSSRVGAYSDLSGTTRASPNATANNKAAAEDAERGRPDEESTATGIPQFLSLDVPHTNRSYWNIPGLRWSTRTTEWPLQSEKPADS